MVIPFNCSEVYITTTIQIEITVLDPKDHL